MQGPCQRNIFFLLNMMAIPPVIERQPAAKYGQPNEANPPAETGSTKWQREAVAAKNTLPFAVVRFHGQAYFKAIPQHT